MSTRLIFTEPILEAIVQLAERNGSRAKDILNFLRKSDKRPVKRNLTLQVRKALKHAVVQGIIRLCGGRYKVPIKKCTNVLEKKKNIEKNRSAQLQSRKQTNRNKIGKISKKLTKGNQTGSKNHAPQKPGKTKKKPKPPSK